MVWTTEGLQTLRIHLRELNMKISITKTLVLGGLCALLAGATGAASAQTYHHSMMHHPIVHRERRHIHRLQAAYARDVAHGRYAAAHKAHLKAKMIRHHIRTQRPMMHGTMMHRDMMHHDMTH
jgi:hypothetical protein